MIFYNVYGPNRLISSWSRTVKIDKRGLCQHCLPESGIVSVLRVCAAVAIIDETAVTDGVVIRPVADSRDRYGDHLELFRLPDARGADQRYPLAAKSEPVIQLLPGEYSAIPPAFPFQPDKQRRTHLRFVNQGDTPLVLNKCELRARRRPPLFRRIHGIS